MNQNLFLIFSLFLLVGFMTPAYAQTSESVVINEVDINPPGDDSKSAAEWVELYNPTDSEIDLSGWTIASTTVLKKTMTITSGTVIQPGKLLTYSYQSAWFTDSNDSIELRDDTGFLIDKTPLFSDTVNDFTSWQRIYDGYDFGNDADWKFVTSTAGSSNGKIIEIQDVDPVIVTISSDKSSYLFGDVAVFEGSVSKEISPVKPEFLPEKIIVHISGPNFNKNITLYPDLNLNYKTTLSLHQTLGINEGVYDVSVTYGDTISNTSFSVGFELIEQIQKAPEPLSILTDKSQYIPGQTVLITGLATEIIPFEGMKFSVTDPEGMLVANGNLFPTNGEFKTSVFLTIVNPKIGTYDIVADYSDKSTSATFDVVDDVKEDVPISLWTDKEFYGLGDVVNITGRVNEHWVESLDLEILQTKSLSLGVNGQSGGGNVLKILDGVRLDGDGRFKYSFTIPLSDSRLGDYWINVNKDVGFATKIIKVVENPETYVPITDPLTLSANKPIYDFSLDNKLQISGQILEPVLRTSFEVPVVEITISTEDGRSLEITGLPEGAKRLSTGGIPVGYEFSAVPDSSGFFYVDVDLTRLIFAEGKYLISANYQNITADTSFEIVELLKVGDPTIYAELNKSVFGLGETVTVTGTYGLQTGDAQGVEIFIHKPDGTIHTSGTTLHSGFFSWSWNTPLFEKTVVLERDRSLTPTNFGIYKIHLATGDVGVDLFFKISPTPENDTLEIPPVSVSTSKSLYRAGEDLKVTGQVNIRSQGDEGLVVPDRVQIKVVDGTFPYKQIHEAFVYPNQGGEFSSVFELPITIFDEGSYTVKVIYDRIQIETLFSVANDFTFGIDDPVSIITSIDKSEYHPGDTVIVNGKPNKLIYLEIFDVSIIKQTDSQLTCGTNYCGDHLGPVTSIRPSPSGSFTHQFVIPNDASSIGSYEITVDTDFDVNSITFDVVEKSQTPKVDVIIEKENRIPEKEISIITKQKTSEDLSPRVISASLITTSRDDESSVNLKVSTSSGVCIIGPDLDCLVKESTRKPGQIYDVVEVDGLSLNVRYSGPDVRLEKFSISPESSSTFLPDANWNVEVIKDDQVSRLYYKVTYKTLE